MRRTAIKAGAALAAAYLLSACSGQESEAAAPSAKPMFAQVDCNTGTPPPAVGLMTSLPIYWDIDQSFEDIAQGKGEQTWQRAAVGSCYSLTPLDTLSPITGLSPDEPETDPLSGLKHLAVIQPRGLSPSDNVALDNWVRAGGRLLLVLDPMLTGEYHLPLGDPRRPTDTALIPPVVGRWGMTISYDDEQELALREAKLGKGHLWLSLHGTIALDEGSNERCNLFVNATVARCEVEKGIVTIVADAASFEHALDEVENAMAARPPLLSVMDFAFNPDRSAEASK